MWKFSVVLLILLVHTNSIFIPLSGKNNRCMIVYSVGEAQTVKLDINFPQIAIQDAYYMISWKNTQNNQVTAQTIKNGRYKKQLNLSTNVIYDLCLQVFSSSDFGITLVEYTATNVFAINQAEIKVPQGVLKSSDMTDAFLGAENINKILDSFELMQNNRTQTHAEIHRKTNLISTRMVQISGIELLAIALAGGYQFWAIWRYLKSKHYV